ncbi:hypothetical protein ACSSV1_002274 [Labrenzia sp. MBR-25]
MYVAEIRLMAGRADILKHLKSKHIGVFQSAARLYNVAILVRRTNTASLDHIGEPYATPKRLDCKAKTADYDVKPMGSRCPDAQRKSFAGLVVDPKLAGEKAFKPSKYADVIEAWNDFKKQLRPEMATFEQQKTMTNVPRGGLYFVERNPEDPYFACVKFTSSSLITAAKCVHGDFDLYGIVDMDAPHQIVRVRENRLGGKHTRSPKFFDVQNFVNSRLGAAMVLHGSQETYATEHKNDDLDIFFPSGRVEYAGPAAADIEAFYKKEFPGRTLFRKNEPALDIEGRYISPGAI